MCHWRESITEAASQEVVQQALAEHVDSNQAAFRLWSSQHKSTRQAQNQAAVSQALAEHAASEAGTWVPTSVAESEHICTSAGKEPHPPASTATPEAATAEQSAQDNAAAPAPVAESERAVAQALADHAQGVQTGSQDNSAPAEAMTQPADASAGVPQDVAPSHPGDAPAAVPPDAPPRGDEAEDSAEQLLKDVRDDMGEPSRDQDDMQYMHHVQSLDSFQSASPKTMNRSVRSSPGFTSHSSEDLKSKLQFSSMTTDGVKKGPTFMHTVSNFKTGARWTFGQKGPSTFIASSSTPAPGSYNMNHGQGGGRYKSLPKFSFGGATRFAAGEAPSKKQPGPGAYNPRDPLLTAGPKVSFAGANAGRGPPLPENAPGPGAYEQRSNLGKSKMFTARGRQASSYMRSRSQPGPGAYDPKVGAVLMGIPKCGFGTSIRNDITGAARSLMLPGPGAYDMQSAMSVGKNGPKYSAASRRRVHDLDSYVTPGPGTYNAHTTSFVY
ncbi:Pum2 [Symbiodinium pilosum]|uniref:Pum2 protein n=1 Tax=Symbiodinium pilosum TaxID=2952 RepID=A0A812W1C9_SYMPI|nr:Pum2 [Symbiodinium pilosum]